MEKGNSAEEKMEIWKGTSSWEHPGPAPLLVPFLPLFSSYASARNGKVLNLRSNKFYFRAKKRRWRRKLAGNGTVMKAGCFLPSLFLLFLFQNCSKSLHLSYWMVPVLFTLTRVGHGEGEGLKSGTFAKQITLPRPLSGTFFLSRGKCDSPDMSSHCYEIGGEKWDVGFVGTFSHPSSEVATSKRMFQAVVWNLSRPKKKERNKVCYFHFPCA